MKTFFRIAAAQRGVTFEIWENIPTHKLQKLISDPRFPSNPDKTETLETFDTPVNRAENYGARVITYYQVINLNYISLCNSMDKHGVAIEPLFNKTLQR